MIRKRTRRKSAPPARATRPDGAVTRAHLLDVAGRVFAEHGYAGTASKEICRQAGANLAAVNYHFGGKDGLYEAVLIEAHRQIVSLDELEALADAAAPARTRLKSVLGHLIEHASHRNGSWGVRVIMRELLLPSPLAPALVKKAILPKAGVVMGLIAQIMRLPQHHPAVQKGFVLTMAPCAALLIVPQGLRSRILPALEQDASGMLDDVIAHAIAGLQALAKRHKPRG